MSISINTVILAGYLTRDPQLKPIANDRLVANFSLAINKRYKGADGEPKEEVVFVDIEAWGRTAELVGQYTGKGDAVSVEGGLKLDDWKDEQGNRHTRLKVRADTVHFLSPKRHGASEGSDGAERPESTRSHNTAGAAQQVPRGGRPAARGGRQTQKLATQGGSDQPPF